MSQQNSRVDDWAVRLGRLPRLTRIVIAAIVALLLSVFVSQVVTLIIGEDALYDLPTAQAIFVLTGVVGFIGYIIGWWSLVNFDRDDPAPHHRAVYFVILGGILAAALVVWLLLSLVIAVLPPEIPI